MPCAAIVIREDHSFVTRSENSGMLSVETFIKIFRDLAGTVRLATPACASASLVTLASSHSAAASPDAGSACTPYEQANYNINSHCTEKERGGQHARFSLPPIEQMHGHIIRWASLCPLHHLIFARLAPYESWPVASLAQVRQRGL